MSTSDQKQNLEIRYELPDDHARIRQIITAAFASKSHLDHKEADIVDELRNDKALIFSLVACVEAKVVAHVAASRVLINGQDQSWLGLGPVTIMPEYQRRGIGATLVEFALGEMVGGGFAGCVVSGRSEFYQRLGFEADPAMSFEGAPARFFMRCVMIGPPTAGKVTYHKAFNVARGA